MAAGVDHAAKDTDWLARPADASRDGLVEHAVDHMSLEVHDRRLDAGGVLRPQFFPGCLAAHRDQALVLDRGLGAGPLPDELGGRRESPLGGGYGREQSSEADDSGECSHGQLEPAAH